MADDIVINHRFHKWLNGAILFERAWRKRNITNFDFYDGEQWESDAKAVIESRGQLAAVLNIIRPMVDMVLALEADRRIDFQIVPREASDDLVARLLTELLKQVSDANDCDYYNSRAFREAVIGGRGCIQCKVQKDDSGEKQVFVDHIPWEEVYIDPFHRRPDATDARYIIRGTWVDRDILAEKWPGKADLIMSAFNDDYKGVEYEAQIAACDRGVQYYDRKTDRVQTFECWYYDKTGTVRHVIFAENVFLEGNPDPAAESENESPYKHNIIPLIPLYAFRTHKGEPKGLVEYLLDLQRMLNKENSKYLWNVSANRIMAEDGAIDDFDNIREEWNRPDGVVKLNPGGLGKVQREDNLRESVQILQHMQFLLMMAQRTSGVNDSMLGLGGVNERSAQQQTARITQGTAMQSQLFDNLFHCRKQVTRTVLKMIGQFYTNKRVIRITEPNGTAKYMELNAPLKDDNGQPLKDEQGQVPKLNKIEDILKYDVVLKPVPAFSTVRQNTMQIWSEIGKTGALPPLFIGKVMLELSDLPDKAQRVYELEQLVGEQQAKEQAQAKAEMDLKLATAAGAGAPASPVPQ